MKILLLAIFCLPLLAWAGNEGGNGGDGVFLNGKYYLLDLVEFGVQEDPYFNHDVAINPVIESKVESAMADLPQNNKFTFVKRLLAQKLSEIELVDPLIAVSLLFSIDFYQWRIVLPQLINIKDENSLLRDQDFVQLAIRRDQVIMLNSQFWSILEPAQVAALILHEAIFSLIIPSLQAIPSESESTRERSLQAIQESKFARQINGYMFSREFSTKNKDRFYSFVEGKLKHGDGSSVLYHPPYLALGATISLNDHSQFSNEKFDVNQNNFGKTKNDRSNDSGWDCSDANFKIAAGREQLAEIIFTQTYKTYKKSRMGYIFQDSYQSPNGFLQVLPVVRYPSPFPGRKSRIEVNRKERLVRNAMKSSDGKIIGNDQAECGSEIKLNLIRESSGNHLENLF